jgi:hypothetical protein
MVPCTTVCAQDDLPTFTEDDFSVCDFGPGMEYDYSISEINQELGITFTEVIFGEYYVTESYLNCTITYYRNADEATAEYQKFRNSYVANIIPDIQNGGWDGNALLLLEEQGASETGILYYGSNYNTDFFYYGGLYVLLFGQHYVATFEMAGPAEKMTEQKARDYYAQAQDCLKTVLNNKDRKLWGKVTNAWGKPLPHMAVKLSYAGKEHETTTDANGDYQIPFADRFGKTAKLSFVLQYRDEKGYEYFKIIVHDITAPYQFDQEFVVRDANDLHRDFVVRNEQKASESLGYTYYRMAEAVYFYVDVLHLKPESVAIAPFINTIKTSKYVTGQKLIGIALRDTIFVDYNDTFPMRETEYHEYSHHIMNCVYGRIPQPPSDVPVVEINHAGYTNPSTTDSFVEGFAVFMPEVIKDTFGIPVAGVNAKHGSIEENRVAWGAQGYDELFAAAGILWDLYDGIDARDGDAVSLSLEQIWAVLKNTNHEDMSTVYEVFVQTYPTQKEGIDRIFINHGFFADTDKGNETYDVNEPARTNEDGTVSYFIDLASPVEWNAHEKVGQATNYQRPNRYFPPPKPGHVAKTSGIYPFYSIAVTFAEDSYLDYTLYVEQQEGLIPIPVPPEQYQATIRVEGFGDAIVTGAPLIFTNQEFFSSYGDINASGYFREHDFEITGPIPERPEVDPALISPEENSCLASSVLGAEDPRLKTLRRFRDEVLVKTAAGQSMVRMYYASSRYLIDHFASREWGRKGVAALMKGTIPVIELALR